MLTIKNVIKEVDDGRERLRDPAKLTRIAVHRVGVDLKYGHVLGYNAVDICAAFTGRNKEWAGVAAAAGGQIPYTFMIGSDLGPKEFDGVIWQTLPVYDVGPHARRWNTSAIGVALIGDPRERQPSVAQSSSLVRLLADLCLAFRIDPLTSDGNGVKFLTGHDELPGGSKDPDKRCPGDFMPMASVRARVSEEIASISRARSINRLIEAGMTT